jgi:integrase
MASIHPTRYGTHEIRWRENGRPKSATRKTKRGAEELKLKVEQRGSFVRPKDAETVEDFAAEWLASHDVTRETRALYRQQLEAHVLPFLGHLSIVELKPKRLSEWQKQRLREGAGPAVLGKTQAVLKQILDEAVLPHEYFDSNPILSLKTPAYEKKAHRWLTANEVEQLRMWFLERDDLGSATLISMLAYVGIRPEDALARIWPDLDDKLSVTTKNVNGKIKPGSKTGMAYIRKVLVPEIVAQDFEEWRIASNGRGLMFGRKSDGLPWTKVDYDNWRSRHPIGKEKKRPRCFKRAAEDCGLGETLKPYDLRHTGASLMAAAGWTAVEIAAQLGHSPTESQKTYQHLIHTDRRDRGSIDDYIREARGIAVVRDRFGVEA